MKMSVYGPVLILSLVLVLLISQSSSTTTDDDDNWDLAYEQEEIARNGRTSPRSNGNARSNRGADCELGICERAQNYPKDVIQDTLMELPALKSLFKKRKVPGFGTRTSVDSSDAVQSVCGSVAVTKYPQSMRNKRQEEKFIVNHEGSYQPIVVDTCRKQATCAMADGLHLGYTSTCEQKYSVVRLIVWEGDKKMAMDEFDVACGCVCVVRRVETS